MNNLKALFDAAKAAEAEVERIHAEMSAAMLSETSEGVEKAVGMRDALDAAKAAANDANLQYINERDAVETADEAARKFVPVANHEGKKDAKEMSRAEFSAMSAADQMSFMLADGKLVD